MMKNKKYYKLWLVFVNIKAKENFIFDELIDIEHFTETPNYKGAWANLIVKSNNIIDVVKLVDNGLAELNFEVIFIDKIENISSLIEYNELKKELLDEVNWLLNSEYVFKISDKLFPY